MKKKILAILKKYRAEIIDPYLKDFVKELQLETNIKNLYDAMLYHLNTGGKRWRPTMCLLICKTYGENIEKAMPLAGAIELHHNWTLIHDDIEDGDKTRRNQPAIWKKFGLNHGINIGDGMNEVAFKLLSRGRKKWGDPVYSEINDLIHTHLLRITEGQTMDIDFRKTESIDEKQYMEMIKRKTGDLVVLATVGGAILGEAPKKDQKALKEYSYKVGPAFQIRDDLLDFTEGKGRGGKIGCDVREGKRSLMVVHALNHLSKTKKNKLIKILDKPREQTTIEDVKNAKKLMQSCGSFEYADKKQRKLAKEAKSLIQEHIPQSEAKDLLLGLSDFLIERKM